MAGGFCFRYYGREANGPRPTIINKAYAHMPTATPATPTAPEAEPDRSSLMLSLVCSEVDD